MKVTITRSTVILPDETIGLMFLDGKPAFVTLENRKKMIPAGTYRAYRDIHYGKPGPEDNYEVWELADVPGRTQIQIHVGNSYLDSTGCILIGKGFSYPTIFINRSREAIDQLMEYTAKLNEIEVEIL